MTIRQDLDLLGSVAPVLGHTFSREARRIATRPLRRHRPASGIDLTEYDPQDLATSAHPYRHYRALLQGSPVAYNPRRDLYILTRYEAVRAALRNPDVYSSASGVLSYESRIPMMLGMDRPFHTAQRKIGQGAFTRSSLEGWQDTITELATSTMTTALRGPNDLVQTIAAPVPLQVIAYLMGIPPEDYPQFREWSLRLINVTQVGSSLRDIGSVGDLLGAVRAFHHYLDKQYAEGTIEGSGSVLDRILQASDGGTVGSADVFYFAILLLLAGNETTTNLISTLFLNLARHPDQLALLKEDPSLIPGAIEEQLRHMSPIQNFYRRTTEDTEVDGLPIPAGSRVLVSFGAANRDPRQFADPDTFSVTRDAHQHLAFGNGIHLCLGAALARNEGRAVLNQIVERVDSIRLTGEPVWTTNASLRGLLSLPAELTPA